MELLKQLKNENLNYIDDVPYFDIDGYIFFYYSLNNSECFAICLNKPLISNNDLKLINQKVRNIAKLYVDNIAYKNDFLYITFYDFENIYDKLKEVKDVLYSLSYGCRKNCIVCGKKTSLNKYMNALVPIEKECIEKLLNERKTINDNYRNNIKKSVLLSLLGGLIGIIPAIIVTLILGSYSIMSTILLFICPFLTVLLYNKTPIHRSKKSDLLNTLTSIGFIILYHIIMIVSFVILYTITSIEIYFEAFNYLLLETLLETIFAYVVGLLSGFYLSKKRLIVRLSKKRSEKY